MNIDLKKLQEQLDAFDGKGYNGKLNWCYLDGYYVKWLEREYGMSLEELRKLLKEKASA